MTMTLEQAFRDVLTKAGATPVNADDDGAWFRFEIDGRSFEAGFKQDAWLVTTSVGALKTDPALVDKISKAIRRANDKLPKGMRPAQLAERDSYLRVDAAAPKAWLESDPEAVVMRLAHTLEAARKLAPHAAVSKLLGEFGQ